jgi:hypothetical protein
MPASTNKLSCVVYQGNILYNCVRFLLVRHSFIHGDAFGLWNIDYIHTCSVLLIVEAKKEGIKNVKKKVKGVVHLCVASH